MPLPDILSLLQKRPTITVVDVGAMTLGEGQDPYQPLIDAGIANIIGFEPDEKEVAKLLTLAKPGRTYLPYAIGDGSVQPFHICNVPMTSSLLRPNHDLTDHFTRLSELMHVVRTVEIQTRRMDDIPEVRKTDFLKLDIQGAELQVLKSAKHVLAKTLMVQTEVEFVPLYEGQPLFAEIDIFMRESGFLFHRFTHISGRPFRPMRFAPTATHDSFRQALWGDAVYVRDFRRLSELSPESLLKLAILAHLLCGSFDLAHKCLAHYDAVMETTISADYLDLLRRSA
jgi:FkbM family methyltransferase